MPTGHVALVLNAHLPYVRHSGHDEVAEERWLYQAITEAYIPFFDALGSLERDGVPTRITLALSPTLLAMLDDPVLRGRYLRHLDRLVELAEDEERRTRVDASRHALADMYLARFWRARTLFLDEWQRDLIAAFRAYQECGMLEVIPSAATHAFLPLLLPAPAAVRAQLEVAFTEYRRFFGRAPVGFWLPDCGYDPALDAELARAGVRYVVLDTHAIAHATPRPLAGVYAPIVSPAGVAAFGRDPESAKVLSGGPGGYLDDPAYRDVRRDLVDERSPAPHLARRLHTGIKYHRRTGDDAADDVYVPARARTQAHAHAADFVAARRRHLDWLARTMDRPPVIVCAWDAELFGRWWFEGTSWLEQVVRQLAPAGLTASTPSDYLTLHPTAQRASPAASSWGTGGYHAPWLSGQNGWVYRHLHATTDRLQALCRRYPGADERTRRALTQALRELLLAQSSDWAFLMTRRLHGQYAVQRTKQHLARCHVLCAAVEANDIDDLALAAIEERDPLFPALDYRVLA
jgi:1,4-alpha-glucan branching enzyme